MMTSLILIYLLLLIIDSDISSGTVIKHNLNDNGQRYLDESLASGKRASSDSLNVMRVHCTKNPSLEDCTRIKKQMEDLLRKCREMRTPVSACNAVKDKYCYVFPTELYCYTSTSTIPSDSAILKDREVLLDFCDKPQPNLLVFHVNAAGNLTSSTAFPSSLKTKACFFAKKVSEPLPREPKEKIADALSYGDLSSAALEQLHIYVNDVIVPLLSTPGNHEDWPEVVSSDIQKHVSDLQSQIQVVNSLVKGKILLPYPKYPKPISAKSDNIPTSVRSVEAIDLKFVHAVESVVIEWSHQIREVLKKDSSQPILEGQNPFPAVELEFWKAKRANLESIFEQLNDPRVSKMGELLAKSNSSYHPAFIHLHGEVRQALDEAQDIDTHLRPLASHFESIETADFPDTKQLYKPCFHIIALLWANCRHYTVPSRIIILLQELCNL
ncbi:unnamed protein product, partial [Didymodactylos carnosus]